jgi:apolipoprotein D and lipocalin family protein
MRLFYSIVLSGLVGILVYITGDFGITVAYVLLIFVSAELLGHNVCYCFTMKYVGISITVTTVALLTVCHVVEASSQLPPLQPVEYADLNRYTGVWYEIAHYPNRFQEACLNGTVTFSLRNDGEIDILTSCRDKHDGTLHHADGRGWTVNTINNAQLRFSFFWPFRNEYLIIDQGKDYEYSVIGTPDRKRLWLIARSPVIKSDVFETILQNIEKQGFSREGLIKDKFPSK